MADLLVLTPRERVFAMVAASAADMDGVGLLVSIDYYARYHHVLAHNLLFGGLLAAALAIFSTHRLKAFILFLVLFHVHLLLDFYGSGPGWGIHYFWPFGGGAFFCPHVWDLNSWQNIVAFEVLFLWMFGIVFWRRRTPFEAILPSLDAKIIRLFARTD